MMMMERMISFLFFISCVSICFAAAPYEATITISDSDDYHVYPPGKFLPTHIYCFPYYYNYYININNMLGSTFTVQVTASYSYTGTDRVYYKWQDADSNDLTSNVQLSPSGMIIYKFN